MKTTELTDTDGDALTITQRLDATWITCTKGAEEVTIGPVPTDAIRHAFETPMGDDLADGGVTAAAIEKEAATISSELLEAALAAAIKDTRELTRERDDARGDRNDALRREAAEQKRAVKAEQERDSKAAAYDQLKILFGDAERAAISWRDRARAAEASAEQPLPLTADDITDEMVERGARQYIEEDYTSWERSPALAKNNARESVRGILEAALTEPAARPEGAEELAEVLRTFPGALAGIRDISDHLASNGVRVTGAES